MKKILLIIAVATTLNAAFSQNIFFDDFSSFSLAKIDGQGGWSTSTPSLGNGTGACFSIGCNVSITPKSMSYLIFGSCTQALNPIDGTLATQDGPGKSLGAAINSGSIYVAILVNFSAPLSQPTNAKQVIRFMDNSFTTATRVNIKQIAGGGAFQVGIDKNGAAAIYGSASYGYGQDHLIVLKYKFNTSSSTDDVAAVFVDPDLSLPEPTPNVTASGSTDAATINRIAFPWNSSFLINGFVGIVSTAKDWTSIVPQVATTANIEGNIITPLKKAIQKSTIKLKTTTIIDSVLSATNGAYGFNNLPINDYIFRPTKNNDSAKKNGVSAFDIVLIQNHILNKIKLNSPYKIIAADVTNDKKVSSFDIIFIKRLILGIDTTFAGNRMWAFVDSNYVFPDTTNPFPYKDSISFTNLTSSKINQTFIGVKLGDVNYDWVSTTAKAVSVKSLELVVSDKLLVVNGDMHIPITVKNFKELTALQYTLHFDNTKYEFVNLEGFKNLQGFEYNAKQAATTGNISFLWADASSEPKSLEDGSLLFELILKPKDTRFGEGTTYDSKLTITSELKLSITNDITNIEAWDEEFKQHNIILTQKQSTNNLQSITNNYFSVYPNPAKFNLNIALSSTQNKQVEMQIVNVFGQIMQSQKIRLNVGEINVNSNIHQLKTGIYFIKIISQNGEIKTAKFIKE